jgi:hypothetical protein
MDSKIEKMVKLMVDGTAANAAKAALWDTLSPDEKKQAKESRVFISFANATELIPDPFKHSNGTPDIRTCINGCDYYFELGEITDESLPKGVAHSIKTKTVSGCAFSQEEPLAKMLKQKCEKQYETNGAPVDLLLYYWIQSPLEETIGDYLLRNILEIQELIQGSQYERIWIYDTDSGKVVWKREKYKGWRRWLWLLGRIFLILKRKLRRIPRP